MKITELGLGVRLIEPRRFEDERGFFTESWNRKVFADAGIDIDFMQDNQSFSAAPGTVRGLHCQAPPFAQAKLVRAVTGAILDVAVDARRGSPGYGRHVRAELSAQNGRQMLVPAGFLHGFITLTADCHVLYKVDAPYDRASELSVRFDDPDLAIDWGLEPERATLSDKDARAAGWADFRSPFDLEPGEGGRVR